MFRQDLFRPSRFERRRARMELTPRRLDDRDERGVLEYAEAILGGATAHDAGLVDALTSLAFTTFRDGRLTQALMFARAADRRASRESATAIARSPSPARSRTCCWQRANRSRPTRRHRPTQQSDMATTHGERWPRWSRTRLHLAEGAVGRAQGNTCTALALAEATDDRRLVLHALAIAAETALRNGEVLHAGELLERLPPQGAPQPFGFHASWPIWTIARVAEATHGSGAAHRSRPSALRAAGGLRHAAAGATGSGSMVRSPGHRRRFAQRPRSRCRPASGAGASQSGIGQRHRRCGSRHGCGRIGRCRPRSSGGDAPRPVGPGIRLRGPRRSAAPRRRAADGQSETFELAGKGL